MTRDEINKIAEDSFLTYYPGSRKIKIHIKKSPDETRYNDFVEIQWGYDETIWHVLLRAGPYEVVVLEWIINVYEADMNRRIAKWALLGTS